MVPNKKVEWQTNLLPNGIWEVVEFTEWKEYTSYRTIIRGITRQQAEKLVEEHNEVIPKPIDFDALDKELIIECERAMKQRDVWLQTKISNASHGGSHDTCFGTILRRYFGVQK